MHAPRQLGLGADRFSLEVKGDDVGDKKDGADDAEKENSLVTQQINGQMST